MVHGIFAGSDASRRWMFLIYVVTACIVVFLLILRGLTIGSRPTRRVQSSPGSSPRLREGSDRARSRAGS
jgi:hypothetical protein